jgi:cytochrome P450
LCLLQLGEESYEQPEDFVPERWTSRPDMVRNRSAFFPWSIGPYHCVGKNLGMMEIRLATAMLVTKYDRKFANDEDGTEMKNGGQDCFLKSPGRLRLVFQKRSAAVV